MSSRTLPDHCTKHVYLENSCIAYGSMTQLMHAVKMQVVEKCDILEERTETHGRWCEQEKFVVFMVNNGNMCWHCWGSRHGEKKPEYDFERDFNKIDGNRAWVNEQPPTKTNIQNWERYLYKINKKYPMKFPDGYFHAITTEEKVQMKIPTAGRSTDPRILGPGEHDRVFGPSSSGDGGKEGSGKKGRLSKIEEAE